MKSSSRTLLIILLLSNFFTPFLFAQNIFEKVYDQQQGTEIRQTPDGGFLLKGENFVTKVDADGNELWSKTLTDPMEAFNATDDGGFIKVKTVEVNDPFNTHTDVRLIKTDDNEQVIWETNVGDWMAEVPYAVMQASDGGYLIAGSTDLRGFSGGIEMTSIVCLMKTDASGVMEWKEKNYIGSGEAYANKVIETSSGYVVGGPLTNVNVPIELGIMVMATSKAGVTVDLQKISGTNMRYQLNDMATTNFGTYLLAGSKTNMSNFSNVSELFVEKRGGQFEWTFSKGDGNNFYNGASRANTVVEDEEGNVFVAGWYSGSGGDSYTSALGQSSLMKLNKEGKEEWGQLYPRNAKDAILSDDGHLVFTGNRNGQLNFVHLETEKISDGCPSNTPDFEYLTQHKGSYYYLSGYEWDWRTGDDLAYFFYDGSLASIGSAEENEAIRSQLKEQAFIGITDDEEEGKLEWSNGDDVTYSNLSDCGFCGMNNDERDFGKMNPWDGSWSFDNELVNRRAVMELKCGSEEITMNCSKDVFVSLSSSQLGLGLLTWEIPTASTTCPSGNLIIEQIGGPLRGSYTGELYQMVTYLIMDECGNSTTCNFVVMARSGCPPLEGYEKIGGNGTPLYFISKEKYTPLEMANITLPPDTRFVEFNDPGDIANLTSMLSLFGEMVYIGINDAASEGDLVKADGSPQSFTNFDICDFCAPNSDTKDHVVMNHWNGGWSWAGQYEARKYIIQFDCGSYLFETPVTNELQIIGQAQKETIIPTQETTSLELASIYPNPSSDHIFLKINSPEETTVAVHIMDPLGRNAFIENVNLQKGLNIKELDVSGLTQGVFYVYIPNEKESPISMSFIKL